MMSAHFGFRPGLRPAPPPGIPVYSLITIVRNAAHTLERTLQSVARQTYPAFEYIVVDAGSTDGTVDILKQYEHLITLWCSEPDRGHADGQNKGMSKATGKFIGAVYADDWLEDDFIEKSVMALASGQADFVFGDMKHYTDGEYVFTIKGDGNYQEKILYRAPTMNFPTVSACSYVFEGAGVFDPEYKVAPDYEWLFRVHNAGFKGVYDPQVCYNFSFGGHSTRHINKAVIEVARALTRNGGNPLKIWGYAGVKMAFHAVDDLFRDLFSPAAYSRIRAIRKSITG